jgi:Flp pilus assembly protein TadD
MRFSFFRALPLPNIKISSFGILPKPHSYALLKEDPRGETQHQKNLINIPEVAFMTQLRKQIGDHDNYNQGVEAFNERDFFQAVESFQEAVKEHPEYPDYFLALALAERELGELDEAVEDLRQALQLNPKYIQAKNELAILLAIQGNEEEAVRLYNEAVNHFIYNTQGRPGAESEELIESFQRAISRLKEGEYADAVLDFRKAANTKPQMPDVHFNQAVEYFLQEDNESARIECRQALKLDPYMIDAHVLLCRIAYLENDREEAMRACQDAIQITPNYPDLHYFMALTCRQLEMMEKARTELEHALELHPEYGEALLELADLSLEMEDLDRAGKCLDEFVALELHNPRYDFLLARLSGEKGDIQQAKEKIQKIPKDSPWAEEGQEYLKTLKQ